MVDRAEMISLIQKHQKVKKGTQTKTLVSMLTEMPPTRNIPVKQVKDKQGHVLISMFNPMSEGRGSQNPRSLDIRLFRPLFKITIKETQTIHTIAQGRSDAALLIRSQHAGRPWTKRHLRELRIHLGIQSWIRSCKR